MKRKKHKKIKTTTQKKKTTKIWQEQQESNNEHTKERSKWLIRKSFWIGKKNSKWCYKPKMKHGDVKHEQT